MAHWALIGACNRCLQSNGAVWSHAHRVHRVHRVHGVAPRAGTVNATIALGFDGLKLDSCSQFNNSTSRPSPHGTWASAPKNKRSACVGVVVVVVVVVGGTEVMLLLVYRGWGWMGLAAIAPKPLKE